MLTIMETGEESTYIKEEDLADIEICLNEVANDISEESKNTNKATDVSWRIFAHFLEEKFSHLNMETITKLELNDILSKFYVEVRKKNGDMYTKSSMNSIRFGIQRKFKQIRSNFDIIEDAEFNASSEMFKAQCIHLKRQGLAKVEHKPSIKRSDMIKLYTSPVLSHEQPKSLQRKVFLDVMLFLCKRGQENFREMRKSNFAVKRDLNGVEYVEKVVDIQSNQSDDNPEEGGIMASTGTKICPVYSFKYYLSRLDPDSDIFFQRPKPFAPPSGPWFHPLMLGKHCFGKMMKGISKDANLSFNYTNHCIRATSVSVLDDAGLEARHIMAVSGHKSESSIRSYARSGLGTKRKMSDALAFYVNPENENKILENNSSDSNGQDSVVVFVEPLKQVSFNKEEAPRKRSPVPDSSDDSESESKLLDNDPNENEMASLLNSFGADVSKNLNAKRKRFTQFTQTSMKTSNMKYDDVFTKQETEREKLIEEYGHQVATVFSQWETDIQKSKEANEELENIIQQLQKRLQQQRAAQSQRLKSLKCLHEQYMQTSSDLANMHKEQQICMHSELRKELTALQKKIMDEARQEEITNVRKSLQTMLSSV